MANEALDLLAVGAINIDYVLRAETSSRTIGDLERLIPRAEALLRLNQLGPGSRASEPGGSAFNTARAVSSLRAGLNVGFLGVLGLQEGGDPFVSTLDRHCMPRDLVRMIPDDRPGVCFASIDPDTGHRELLTSPFANEGMANWLRDVWEDHAEQLSTARAVHITSLFDDARSADDASSLALAEFVERMRDRNPGILISFDPGGYWISNHRGLVERIVKETDVLFVNGAEFATLARMEGTVPTEDGAHIILNLCRRASTVVVLKGADEVHCFQCDGGEPTDRIFRADLLPSNARRNPVGTGDTLAAGFLAAQLLRLDVEQSVCLGQDLARHRLFDLGTAEAEDRYALVLRQFRRHLREPISRRWDRKLQEIVCRFHRYAERLQEPPAHSSATLSSGGPALKITNEYGIHYLLYVLLRGEWDSVDREVQTPGRGGRSGRCDLGVEELDALIECKFVKSTLHVHKVTRSLEGIAERYARHPGYSRLFIFIYDPTGAVGREAFRDFEGEHAGFTDIRIGIAGPRSGLVDRR